MNDQLDLAVVAAKQADLAIMSVYKQSQVIEIKKYGSPLTQADQSTHHAFIAILSASGLPIMS